MPEVSAGIPTDMPDMRHVVLTPLWADPLCTPGDQFPLAPPAWWWEGSEEDASADPSVRPFSLWGLEMGDKDYQSD